jgi:hypothetical protein
MCVLNLLSLARQRLVEKISNNPTRANVLNSIFVTTDFYCVHAPSLARQRLVERMLNSPTRANVLDLNSIFGTPADL